MASRGTRGARWHRQGCRGHRGLPRGGAPGALLRWATGEEGAVKERLFMCLGCDAIISAACHRLLCLNCRSGCWSTRERTRETQRAEPGSAVNGTKVHARSVGRMRCDMSVIRTDGRDDGEQKCEPLHNNPSRARTGNCTAGWLWELVVT